MFVQPNLDNFRRNFLSGLRILYRWLVSLSPSIEASNSTTINVIQKVINHNFQSVRIEHLKIVVNLIQICGQ